MKPLKISIGVRLSPGMLRLGLLGALLSLGAIDLSSESVTLSTYFPAPSGVYSSLITTTGARLARDNGTAAVVSTVLVGNNAPAGTRMAVMNGNMGIGTLTPGAKLGFNDLNDGSNGADGITWYGPAPTTYGIHRTAGAWSAPNYQQLRSAWDTGIVIDGGTAYGQSGTIIQPGAGNVGIGVVSPTSKLHVNGTIVARGCGAPAPVSYAGGMVSCPANTYATWSTGFIAKYMNQTGPAAPTLAGQMYCCACASGTCPNL
jgi:hypothetical protein